MSDELRRRLARAAGDGDIESFRQLGLLLQREGKDVQQAAASLLGFTSSAPEAFRAIRNNALVKATVDVLNRERARWLGERLRAIRDRFAFAGGAHTNEVATREWNGAMADLSDAARRAESQRYPEFFEDWAAANEAIADAPLALHHNTSQEPSADLQDSSEPTANTASSTTTPPDAPTGS